MIVNTDYDDEEDILYFYPNEKNVDFSIDYDDIILDVSGNKIVGIEIMNASEKFIENEEDSERIKQALNSIKQAFMKVKYGINSIFVRIGFISAIPKNAREGMLIQVPIKREMMIEV